MQEVVRELKTVIRLLRMSQISLFICFFLGLFSCFLYSPPLNTPYTQEDIEIMNEHGLTHKDQLWVKLCEVQHQLELLDVMYLKLRDEIHEVSDHRQTRTSPKSQIHQRPRI